MAETNEFFIRVGADVEDAKNKLNQLGSQLSQLANSTQKSGNMIGGSMDNASKQISSAFRGMGIALTTAGITAGLFAFVKSALSTAAQLEQTSVAFEVFTGSAETASEMLAQLKDQALKSPMQFLDITKGAQILLQYGLTAEQVVPITKMLGDVSAGNADKFNRLALAFGQVNASGRLMGQEARQMINAGFNPLQAISDKTGLSMAVLTQRMHDGQISVKEVGDAFIAATSEGGRFFGMADKQSQTLQGAYNKLAESISFAMGDVGDSIAKAFNLNDVAESVVGFFGEIKGALNSNKDVAETLRLVIEGLRITFGLLKNVIIFLVNSFQDLSKAFIFIVNDGKPVIDFFSNLIKGAYEYLKSIKYVGAALEFLIGKFTKIDNAQPKLEAPKVEEQPLTGLNATPSKKEGVTKKAERIEVIPGLDFQTKAYGEHLKKLMQMSANAVTEINNIGLDGNRKKLADLQDSFQKQQREFMRYGIDTTNITRAYLLKVAQLSAEVEAEKQNMLLSLIKPLPTDADRLKNVLISDERLGQLSAGLATELKLIQDATLTQQNAWLTMYNTVNAASKSFTESLSGSFADMFISIGQGGSAGDAIKSFGAGILGALGDMFIKIGVGVVAASKAMLAVQAFITSMFTPFGVAAGLAGGLAMIAVGGLLKGTASAMGKAKSQGAPTTGGATMSQRASGSNYSYGGGSFPTQTMRLLVDLTGSITATQTGYSINKSFETTLRVTGR
jgi:tape measure domain-containing protein